MGVPLQVCAIQYAEAIKQYIKNAGNTNIIEEIHFLSLNKDIVKAIKQTFHAVFVENKTVDIDSKSFSLQTSSQVTKDQSGNTKGPLYDQHERQRRGNKDSKVQTNTGWLYDWKDGTPLNSPPSSRTSQTVTNEVEVKPNITCHILPSGVFKIQFGMTFELQLYTANIFMLQLVDAIVVNEDISGHNKGTIAQEMLIKGGKSYTTAKEIAFNANHTFGDVIISNGGESSFKYVLHALLDKRHYFEDISDWYVEFQKVLQKIFSCAVLNGCHTIAMPIFGTGKLFTFTHWL